MGAGILPTTIYNNKLYFLFGKENKFADTPGWSDFGGGTESGESFMKTAIREGTEELTGFLGNEITTLLKTPYIINWDTYREHIIPLHYNPFLTKYYNNNQQFLQKRLDSKIIKNSRIFEKCEIRWVCIDDIKHIKFRPYYNNIIALIKEQHVDIEKFIRKNLKKSKTRKNI